MNKNIFPGGPGLRRLLMGGLAAGALGLAFSETGASGSKDAGTSGNAGTGVAITGHKADTRDDSSGEFGVPANALDTGSSASAEEMPGASGSEGGTGQADSAAAMVDTSEVVVSEEVVIATPIVTTGWKIRVCSEKTKAATIDFKVSPADDKEEKASLDAPAAYGSGGAGPTDQLYGEYTGPASHEDTSQALTEPGMGGSAVPQTAMWSQGDPTEISLPSEIQDAEKIKIEATPGEKGKEASACILYNDHVAKKMKFDAKEEHTVKKSDTGECGC